MKLIIMRHGEAAWPAGSDRNRPLTAAGRDQAHRTATQLRALRLGVSRILVSSYCRAQQTAGIAADLLGCNVETVGVFTPDDDPAEAIGALPEAGQILVVSHMPLVSRLTGLLCDGDVFRGPRFGTACAAVLDTDLPAAGLATLTAMVTPNP